MLGKHVKLPKKAFRGKKVRVVGNTGGKGRYKIGVTRRDIADIAKYATSVHVGGKPYEKLCKESCIWGISSDG